MLVKVPSWHYADAALPAGATSLPLRDALARCYDLRQPKPELLQLLHSKLQAAAAGSGVAANGHAAAENGSAANGTHAANGTAKAGGKKKGGKGKARQQQNGQQNGQQQQQQNGGSAAAHDDLCSQGCVVDKLEVGHSAGLLFFWSVHWLDVPAVVSESFGWPHPENELLADWRHNRKTSGTYCPGLPPLPSFLPQRLEALTADTAAAEAYLAPRHVIDVLRDFRLPAGATLGPAELLGTLRQLQPRLYSISSSQVGGLVHSCRQDCAHSCRDMQRCHWLRVHGCSCAPTCSWLVRFCCLPPSSAAFHHRLLSLTTCCSLPAPSAAGAPHPGAGHRGNRPVRIPRLRWLGGEPWQRCWVLCSAPACLLVPNAGRGRLGRVPCALSALVTLALSRACALSLPVQLRGAWCWPCGRVLHLSGRAAGAGAGGAGLHPQEPRLQVGLNYRIG